jgi:hypothetical protein
MMSSGDRRFLMGVSSMPRTAERDTIDANRRAPRKSGAMADNGQVTERPPHTRAWSGWEVGHERP